MAYRFIDAALVEVKDRVGDMHRHEGFEIVVVPCSAVALGEFSGGFQYGDTAVVGRTPHTILLMRYLPILSQPPVGRNEW